MLRRLFFIGFRPVYQFNQAIVRRFTLPGLTVLGGMIGAGVIGVDTRQNMAHQLFSLLFCLLALALLATWRFRPRLSIERELPPYATVGEPLRYRVRVHNHGRRLQRDLQITDELVTAWPRFATLRQSPGPAWRERNRFDRYIGYTRWLWLLARQRGASLNPVALPPVPPQGSVPVELSLTPQRRGYIEFARLRLARPDPLGLCNALARIPQPGRLLVLPQRYPLPPLQLPGTRHYQRGGVQLAQSIGNQDEFVGLRDYRPGDPLKLIHWRSTAKRGKPLVKELADEFYTRHALILDTFCEPADSTAQTAFEAAVAVAASVTTAADQPDTLLDLLFAGPRAYQFTAGRGVGQLEQLLTVLACVEPHPDENFAALSAVVKGHANTLSGCVCVLLAWDEPRQALVQALRARHIPVKPLYVGEAGEVGPAVHRVRPSQLAADLAAWSG